MLRPLFRSRLAPGLLAALTLLGGRTDVAAQAVPAQEAAPIMTGPIRSFAPDSVPVEFVRVFLTLETRPEASIGTAAVHAAAGPDSLLVLNVHDLEVTAVRAPELDGELDWTVDEEQLVIRVPEGARDGWRIDVEYRIESALRVLESDGRVTAYWTSSLPGRATWLPLPEDELSAADYYVTIAAPPGWSLAVSASDETTTFELDGRSMSRSAFNRVYPRAVGFLSWRPGMEAAPEVLAPDEAMQALGLDVEKLRRILGDTVLPAYTLLTTGGESIPAAFNGMGVRSTGRLDRSNDWMRTYEHLWRDYQLAITPALARLAPTDYWIEPALSAWLAIEQLRAAEGDAAAGLVLDELRQRYLAESSLYVRPLVWDRWHVASDLRDSHAEAKGAWVLRMLYERIGEEAFFEAFQRFIDEARRNVVDSETLRKQFEIVSREDLGQFFDTWVYAAGHPVISLSYLYDSSSEQTELEVKQHQEGSLVPETFVFDAAFQYSTLAETNSVTLRVDERERRAQLPTGIEPRFVHPDALATVPLDFETAPMQSDLVSQLRYSMDAASTIRSLHLLSNGALDPTLLLGLRSVITATADPAILTEAAPVLSRMAPSSSALSLLATWTKHEDARVRAAAATALAAFKDSPEAYNAALAVANAGQDAFELAAAVRTLATLRPGSAWAVLRSALVTPSEGELVRIQALEMIGPETADDDAVASAVLPLLDSTPDVSAAALLCLARLFPEGPRTTRTAEAWLTDSSSIRREAAVETISMRASEDIPVGRLEVALKQESDIAIRRSIQALLASIQNDSASESDGSP